jgi:hypothetical protein
MDAAEAEQRKVRIMNDATNICSKVEKWLDSNTTEYNICWDDIGDNDSHLTPSYCKSIWERLTLEKYLGNQREVISCIFIKHIIRFILFL